MAHQCGGSATRPSVQCHFAQIARITKQQTGGHSQAQQAIPEEAAVAEEAVVAEEAGVAEVASMAASSQQCQNNRFTAYIEKQPGFILVHGCFTK